MTKVVTDSPSQFVAPTSIEDARTRRMELADDVQAIQAQLSERNVCTNGERMPDHEYWAWRSRACVALKFKIVELRQVKAWIHEHSQRNNENMRVSSDDRLARIEIALGRIEGAIRGLSTRLDNITPRR